MQLLLTLIISAFVYAAPTNSVLVSCEIPNQQFKGQIDLDSVGNAYLVITSKKEKRTFLCGLQLDFFRDNKGAMAENLSLEISRGNCNPDLPAYIDKEVLKNLMVFIEPYNKKIPTGRVQWLKSSQPELCEVKKLNLPEMQSKAKLWLERKWGKSQFSNPQKYHM